MYLVLDIETIRDDDAVLRAYREVETWDGTTPIYESDEACVYRAEAEICNSEEAESCFWPLRFQRPVLVSLVALDPGFNYISHRSVFGTDTKRLATEFWQLVEQAPALLGTQHIVTFNGKGFDMPVMEIQAFLHGLSCPWWFRDPTMTKPWDDPRAYSQANKIHLDVFNLLATNGRVGGSLSYWARTFGLPGKVDTRGNLVDELYAAGDWDRIQDYCLCDVLNTTGILMGYYNAMSSQIPGPRSAVFENTMTTIIEARRKEGTTSKELERYWKLYGPEIPF